MKALKTTVVVKTFALLVLAMPALFVGCNYKVDKSGGGGRGQIWDKAQGLPTYAKLTELVLGPKCFNCHDGSREKDLRSYATFLNNLLLIQSDIESGRMPKGTTLTSGEKDLVLSWIAAGAPEDGVAGVRPTPTPIPVDVIPDYATLSSVILAPKCFTCHDGARVRPDPKNPGKMKGAKDLRTYELFVASIVSVKDEVESGDMPPQKKKAPPLTDNEKTVLLNWIAAGAPVNGGRPDPSPTPSATPVDSPTPSPTSSPSPSPTPEPSATPAPTPFPPEELTFKNVYTKVFSDKCSNCHDGLDPDPKAFDISDYTETMKHIADMHDRVNRVGKGQMPPEKKRQLTAAELALLNAWLAAGAPQ